MSPTLADLTRRYLRIATDAMELARTDPDAHDANIAEVRFARITHGEPIGSDALTFEERVDLLYGEASDLLPDEVVPDTLHGLARRMAQRAHQALVDGDA